MASATIVLSTVFGKASDMLDPAARNSNLLPVKANGEVRLRSPPCLGSGGSIVVPSSSMAFGVEPSPLPLTIESNSRSSSAPRKIEMIAGGASLAPRRWSCPELATDARSSAWCLLTAWMTAVQKNRNIRFSCGVSPGSSRLVPVSVPIDQLLCLPEPLTPAKGFSCSRQIRPYLRATLCRTCIVSCWWSQPTLEFSKIGAISYWLGATSLWRGFSRAPRLCCSPPAPRPPARGGCGGGAQEG